VNQFIVVECVPFCRLGATLQLACNVDRSYVFASEKKDYYYKIMMNYYIYVSYFHVFIRAIVQNLVFLAKD
jgi:hypothetical protein